jgi:hypothetical protein
MDDADDDLDERPRTTLRRKRPLWPLVLALLVGAAYLGWRYYQNAPVPPPPPVAGAAPDASVPPPTIAPEEGEPTLDALLSSMSNAPELRQWLKQGLIRRIAAAIDRVAEGDSPAPAIPFMAPNGNFKVKKKRVRKKVVITVDPRSYARFDRVTRVLTSIDMAKAAQAYPKLSPFLEAAYREVARPGKTFDQALHLAIDSLLAVPPPPKNVELVYSGLTYEYADEGLESRTDAAKQVMRLGPINMLAIQEKLRQLKAALPAGSANPKR